MDRRRFLSLVGLVPIGVMTATQVSRAAPQLLPKIMPGEMMMHGPNGGTMIVPASAIEIRLTKATGPIRLQLIQPWRGVCHSCIMCLMCNSLGSFPRGNPPWGVRATPMHF